MTELKLWGNLTWDFLHCMIVLCPEDKFAGIRTELISCIIAVCNILPCPLCRRHAAHYMSKRKWHTVQNKMDFHNLLVDFHNSVNNRQDKPSMAAETAYTLYENKNMRSVANAFGNYYLAKRSPGTAFNMMNVLTDRENIKTIRVTINKNIHKYPA